MNYPYRLAQEYEINFDQTVEKLLLLRGCKCAISNTSQKELTNIFKYKWYILVSRGQDNFKVTSTPL